MAIITDNSYHMYTLYTIFCTVSQMVDDHEELLSNSVAKLERIRHKHERLSKILISVKAGVEHLQDKLKSTASEVSRSLPSYRYATRANGNASSVGLGIDRNALNVKQNRAVLLLYCRGCFFLRPTIAFLKDGVLRIAYQYV